ncbi:GntR family transcriptional regulator [Siccirubricoccus deserti]
MTMPPANSALARGQGVALWRQIAGSLEAEIAAGGLAPGARLPTEAELTARFRVNRHTVRRAMEELENRGLVRVEQGVAASSPRMCWTIPSAPAPASPRPSAGRTASRRAASSGWRRCPPRATSPSC